MARGRPPKPTALKALAGNPGKRKLNDAEPKPLAKRPPCPPHFTGEARKEWNRMSKQLLELGLLTSVDRAALAGYCQAWAQWVEANEHLGGTGPGDGMIVKTENGFPILSPWWTVANQSAKQMKSFLTEFGMTPGSRSRLRVTETKAKLTVDDVLNAAVNGDS